MAFKKPRSRNYNGLNPSDSVGNRRSHKEIFIPHDGIGNQLELSKRQPEVADNIGNSIDSVPTHMLSSINRRKVDRKSPDRVGRYFIGGVNPLIASANHPLAQEASDYRQNSQTEKRLKKLFEIEDDARLEYTLTSTPEQKLEHALEVLKTIFDKAEAEISIKGSIEIKEDKPSLELSIQDKDSIFKSSPIALAALNFLTNKIANKDPTDRIKMSLKAI